MPTGKLTLRSVKGFEKAERTQFLWDDEVAGFGLRITPNGAKAYVYQYRMGGREADKKRVTIGRPGSPWTPETARAEAKRLAMMVGQGVDPVAADKERRRQTVDLAFSAYAESFVTGYLKNEWVAWEQGESMLKRLAVPVLKKTPLPRITRADIVRVLDQKADQPATLRLLHATLRLLFKWAVDRGAIERSPMDGMKAPGGVEARDRVLSDDELRVIWQATEQLGFPFGPMYRLLITTGQRREEIAALDWSELDRANATWTLPAARAKNDNSHIVPLNDLAMSELDAMAAALSPGSKERKWPKRGLAFSTTGSTPVSGYSRGKARLDREVDKILAAEAEKAGEECQTMAPWRVHDFRRTFATGLQRLGIRLEVTEATLNHISGSRSGIVGVYQRHNWADEKRSAFEAWSRHVSSILSPVQGDNVLKLMRRTAA